MEGLVTCHRGQTQGDSEGQHCSVPGSAVRPSHELILLVLAAQKAVIIMSNSQNGKVSAESLSTLPTVAQARCEPRLCRFRMPQTPGIHRHRGDAVPTDSPTNQPDERWGRTHNPSRRFTRTRASICLSTQINTSSCP